MKRLFYILLFAVFPLFMDGQTATVTYNFTGSAEGWSWTTVSGAPTSAGYANNRFEFAGEIGRNKTATGYWQITGTFASIFGVDAGSTVTGYSNASFSGGCTIWTSGDYYYEGDVGAVYGALNINDGTDRILISNQSSYTGTGQSHTPDLDPSISGLSLAGSTSITMRLYISSGNVNNASAQVGGYVDDISVTIDYTTPSGRRRSMKAIFIN